MLSALIGGIVSAFALAAAPLGAVTALDPVEADAPQGTAATQLAPDVFFLPGGFPHGWSPDGNTVVLRAPDGLIVYDTGRHVWHSNAILSFAAAQRRPIAAIVNSHWHLDHTAGNHRILQRFPDVHIYASRAAERALQLEAADVADARQKLADLNSHLSPHQRTELQIYVDAMDAPVAFRGTDPVERSQLMSVAGRTLEVNLAQNAVTDGDVWLYDRRTHIAIVGDIVTMPTPWFESACPDGWAAALDAVWATPFSLLVPGHGEPMTRLQFDVYRRAFHAFVDCMRSQTSNEQCATNWRQNITPLLEDTQDARDTAEGMALYYIEFLRHNNDRSPTCLAH